MSTPLDLKISLAWNGVQPLPWKTVKDNHVDWYGHSLRVIWSEQGTDVAYVLPMDEENGNATAAYIVKACNEYPKLLEEVEYLRRLRDEFLATGETDNG